MNNLLPFKNSYEMSFRGTEYIVNVKAEMEKLNILIEEKLTVQRWKGEWTSKTVESITQRANHEKSYADFVKIFLIALEQKSRRIYIDFLNFQDIQMFKAKRSNNEEAIKKASSTDALQNTKRYVILTYMTEYDKAHFPL